MTTPLFQNVWRRARELGLSRSALVRRIGYRNISKGLRRLGDFLAGDYTPELVHENLAEALEIDVDLLAAWMQATDEAIKAAKEDAVRREYRPFLHAVTERRIPEQVFTCGICGFHRLRTLVLPEDFGSLEPAARETLLRERIGELVGRYKGHVPTFGLIRHFVLSRDFDEDPATRLLYDTSGREITGPEAAGLEKRIPAIDCYVRIGRQRAEGLYQA